MMRKHTRRLWLPEEDRIVDRYARSLAAGRYADAWRAAEACEPEIERLYARLTKANPAHPVASRPRPFASIRRRIRARLEVLGLAWTGIRLSPAEETVVRSYVKALARRRYPHVHAAAVECRKEIMRLPKGSTPARPRSLVSIRSNIYARARRSIRSWAFHRWNSDDDATVKRYAGAVVAGRYPNGKAALRECCRELAGAGRQARPASAVLARMYEHVRAMGLHHYPRWLANEEHVYRRYLRLLFEGRYRFVRDAADACADAMSELHGTPRPRSPAAVYVRMNHDVAGFGLPRYKGETTPDERRLYEKYARKVAAGEYANCQEAAAACRSEVGRMYGRIGRQNPLGVSRFAARPPGVVHAGILAAASRLNLQFPGRRWLPAEQRIFEGWLRWYERYHLVRRLEPLTQAATGLSDDLAKKGFRRSACACRERLVETRRLRLGLT